MKKLLSLLIIGLTGMSLFLIPATVGAVEDPLNDACGGSGAASDSAACSSRSPVNNPVVSVIVDVIQILLTVIGVVAVIVIMVAGFRYVTSSGDPGTINAAKNTILFAVIGLVIAVSAQIIIAFVLNEI